MTWPVRKNGFDRVTNTKRRVYMNPGPLGLSDNHYERVGAGGMA